MRGCVATVACWFEDQWRWLGPQPCQYGFAHALSIVLVLRSISLNNADQVSRMPLSAPSPQHGGWRLLGCIFRGNDRLKIRSLCDFSSIILLTSFHPSPLSRSNLQANLLTSYCSYSADMTTPHPMIFHSIRCPPKYAQRYSWCDQDRDYQIRQHCLPQIIELRMKLYVLWAMFAISLYMDRIEQLDVKLVLKLI